VVTVRQSKSCLNGTALDKMQPFRTQHFSGSAHFAPTVSTQHFNTHVKSVASTFRHCIQLKKSLAMQTVSWGRATL